MNHSKFAFVLAPAMGLFLILGLGACQTSELTLWHQVQPGMDKGEVLEIMGSPTATHRFHGKDRWLYRFYEKEKSFKKEVHFSEGIAVHVGEELPVALENSAAYIDAKNEADNSRLREEVVSERKQFLEDYAAWEAAGGRPETLKRQGDPSTPAAPESTEPSGTEGHGNR